VILGSIIAAIGVAAIIVRIVRRRSREPILLWFGLFAGPYGVRLVTNSFAFHQEGREAISGSLYTWPATHPGARAALAGGKLALIGATWCRRRGQPELRDHARAYTSLLPYGPI
jgi:hypothetical protein